MLSNDSNSMTNVPNSNDPVLPSSGSTPTKCHICNKYYKNMAAHLKDHKRERKFECDYCHRKFVWKYKLVPHMDVHVAGQRYKCSHCPKGFSFKSSLEYHLRSHTNQNVHLYQCEFCGKEFKYPHTLTTHLRTHTKEKPYKCTLCEKSYSQYISLRHHIMIHNGQKPYHCDICGKGFSDLTGVKLHKRTHTNENPFICHLCAKATKTIGNLKSHYSYVHKIKDITGRTIQNNSKIFAKYTAEELKTIGLLEILSREAVANVLKQENRVEDNVVCSRGPKSYTQSTSQPPSSEQHAPLSSEQSTRTKNMKKKIREKNRTTENHQSVSLFRPKDESEHKQCDEIRKQTRKQNIRSTNDLAFEPTMFIKSENSEIGNYNEDSSLSAPYNDPVSPTPTEEMIVDVKPDIYFDDENAQPSSNPETEILKAVVPDTQDMVSDTNNVVPDTNNVVPEMKLQLNFVLNDSGTALQLSKSDCADVGKTVAKPVKSKPKRNRQKREGDLFICDICNKSYKKKDHLKGHIITHSEKNFICEQCGNKFHNTSNLRRHVRLRHSNDRPFACHLCVFRTKTNYSLKVHLRSHFNVKIFKCTYCDKCFSGSTNRDSHQRSHTGLTISGAISLAVAEINLGKLKTLGHSLAFIVGETYGEEVSSIRQTASLWKNHVSGYIGPQETCVHEGRMAAAFNLPMISYFCTHEETSNKKDFPSFARTRPPDPQISKSVVSLLLAYKWNKVTFLYLDSIDDEFGAVAETVLSTLKFYGIDVHKTLTWNTIYHHGYMRNPFDELVESTFLDTRIYLILSHQYEHIGLMTSLYQKGLLDKGEYFVVGVDIEQYDSNAPDKYLRGLLQDKTDKQTVLAFQSYLAIVPSAPVAFGEFARLVNQYMEMEPFNFPNPLGHMGGVKQIRAEAAYLYDAVHLYARALIKQLENNENPKNGTAIIDFMKGTSYLSAMGYLVYIDENGDAAGNYTLLSIRTSQNNTIEHGLYPIGTFNAPQLIEIPELQLFDEIKWVGSGPPIAEPRCGFRGEKCISYTGEISAGIAGGALVTLILVSLVLYRNWRYEQELDSLLWKVDYKEIQMHENDKENNCQQKQTRATHPLIRTSQVSLSSNPDADFRYSTIFTPIGIYKGQLYAIKKVRKKCIDITREMKMELKMLRDLRHDNICAFIGACTDPPNICILTEYCTRGSLKDVLENEDVKLDNMFTASMVADIIRGMLYLHDSPLRYHGSLSSSNCLIDSRWVVKLSDFGLQAFKKGSEETNDIQTMNAKCLKLLYRAPELLRLGPAHEVPGTSKGDIYSFGIVLYEIHTRHGPFGETGLSPIECLKKVLQPIDSSVPFRPSLQPLESSFDCVRECLKECWLEKPEDRPDLKAIRTKLRPLRKGMRANIFDNMMAMMEKYANNLEALVDERTDQLQEEKKKTDALLLEMLPRPVAEQLKKGNKVEAETYELVTIYFSDIVGFTAMSAESTPLQVVDFLNDLYTCFDSIIGNYDVYKVETIGDAYMVVSGLPIRNGILHVAEIASMSLHLLNAVSEFKIRHRPHEQLLLRIGIHCGPVCSGVVGLKMPRYCLFGDTVNTASRMESTGLPLKIHCSGSCKELLDQMGGYDLQERGFIPMKGKGDQKTYWLLGEDETARQSRTKERNNRRGSRALMKAQLSELKPNTSDTAPKSSLKSRRHFPQSLLPRSSSLESPKKLRFASGNLLLEHHRYHRYSDDALMEVLSDTSPRKSNGSIGCEDITSSCPCIEHFGSFSDSPTSCPTASTPLL